MYIIVSLLMQYCRNIKISNARTPLIERPLKTVVFTLLSVYETGCIACNCSSYLILSQPLILSCIFCILCVVSLNADTLLQMLQYVLENFSFRSLCGGADVLINTKRDHRSCYHNSTTIKDCQDEACYCHPTCRLCRCLCPYRHYGAQHCFEHGRDCH